MAYAGLMAQDFLKSFVWALSLGHIGIWKWITQSFDLETLFEISIKILRAKSIWNLYLENSFTDHT